MPSSQTSAGVNVALRSNCATRLPPEAPRLHPWLKAPPCGGSAAPLHLACFDRCSRCKASRIIPTPSTNIAISAEGGQQVNLELCQGAHRAPRLALRKAIQCLPGLAGLAFSLGSYAKRVARRCFRGPALADAIWCAQLMMVLAAPIASAAADDHMAASAGIRPQGHSAALILSGLQYGLPVQF